MISPITTLLLSALFVLSFLYTGLNLYGVGVPALLVAVLILYSAFNGKLKYAYLRKVPAIRAAFYLYVFYSLLFFLALYLSSSLAPEDVRYFISLVLQAAWFPAVLCFLAYNRLGLIKVMKISLVLSGVIIVLFWLLNIILSGDFFTLRNGSGALMPEDYFFVPDVFSNPNLTGRAVLLLLVCSMYFAHISTRIAKARLWKILCILLTLVIFSTLSRAVISGAIALWLVVAIVSQKQKSNKLWLLFTAFVLVSLALMTPVISERIDDGIVRLSEVRLGFGSEQIGVRDTTIRGRTWGASIQIIRDNVLAGIGVSKALDTLRFYGAVHHKRGEESAIWVHGGFLKQALYSGMLGLGSFLLFYLYVLKTFFKESRFKRSNLRSMDPRAKAASVFGLSLMVALVPVNIGADSFGFSMTWFVVAFFLCESQIKWRKRNTSA